MLKSPTVRKKIVFLMVSAALGALLTRSCLFGKFAPFAAILPVVLPLPYGAAAAVGALLCGAFTVSTQILGLIAAFAAALITRLRGQSAVAASCVTSGAYFLSSAALCAFSGGGIRDFLAVLAISLCFCGATFFCSAVYAAFSSAKSVTAAQMIFLCGLITCTLVPAELWIFSVGGTASVCFILFSASRFGAMPAAAVAAACAFGAGLCEPRYYSAYAVLCVPAVLCGLLSQGSPIRASTVMIITLLPVSLIFSGREALGLFADSVAASIIFVVFERPFAKLVCDSMSDPPLESRCQTELLREAVMSVSTRLLSLDSSAYPANGTVSDAVYAKVCAGCAKNSECFESNEQVASRFDEISALSAAGDISQAFPDCRRAGEISRVSLEAMRRGTYLTEKTAERRGALRFCSQIFSAVEQAIADAGRTALPRRRKIPTLSENLLKAVRKTGARPTGCTVYADGSAEVILPLSSRFSETKIAAETANICGGAFSRPERREAGESVILEFMPEPRFAVETWTSQLPSGDDPKAPCGDVAETFYRGGCFYFILSDGMGVGSGAKAAAELLTGLLRDFIIAGFSVTTAVSLASLAMSAALPEESFATLDILKINTFTGAAENYKAGGCLSCVLADSSRSVFRAGGYPIGILDNCDLKTYRFFVSESAAVVMLTDGAVSVGQEEIMKTVSDADSLSAEAVADGILEAVSEKNDDITVSVVKIRKIKA